MARLKAGHVHAHGCKTPSCRERYDDNCNDLVNDGLCAACRAPGSESRTLVDNRRPHECCMVNSRLARKEEIVIYALAGTSAWWICRKCSRTFPTAPRSIGVSDD